MAPLVERWRKVCARCRRAPGRCINGIFCPSCDMREREVQAGRNGRGTLPRRLLARLHVEAVVVIDSLAVPRIVRAPQVVDATELMVRQAKRAKGPIAFGWGRRHAA